MAAVVLVSEVLDGLSGWTPALHAASLLRATPRAQPSDLGPLAHWPSPQRPQLLELGLLSPPGPTGSHHPVQVGRTWRCSQFRGKASPGRQHSEAQVNPTLTELNFQQVMRRVGKGIWPTDHYSSQLCCSETSRGSLKSPRGKYTG